MSTQDTKNVMRVWNAGITAEEAMDKYGFDLFDQFAEFKRRIGCRLFTMAELEHGQIGVEGEEREEKEEKETMPNKEYRGLMMTDGNNDEIPLMLHDLIKRGCHPILKMYMNGLFCLAVPEFEKHKLHMCDDNKTTMFLVDKEWGHKVGPMSKKRFIDKPLGY